MKTIKILLFLALLLGFTVSQAEDYYWVGGTGLWSDLNSWRTPAGQIPNEVPDATDNVIFNENSFVTPYDTVYILTGNPTCLNMTWTNLTDTATMWGGSNSTNFLIYGSVTLHPLLRNMYYGRISFMSDQNGNTITCNKSKFSGSIYFEGYGEWILQDTLFAYDSTDWKAIIFGGEDPLTPNPIVYHFNGRLDANEQVMITRGFQTTGNNPREFDFENAHAYMLGNWVLSAENLTFNGDLSYIYIGGEMSNLNGDEIHYHDIDFMALIGTIKNTNIRTFHRKIHFLGSGTLDGKKTEGTEGMFTIDTLIFNGAWTPMPPAPITCEIRGPYHNIHYIKVDSIGDPLPVNLKMGVDGGYFHRIDIFGGYLVDIYNTGFRSELIGAENTIDTMKLHFQEFVFLGGNTVTGLLHMRTRALVGGSLLNPNFPAKENNIEHAIMGGDGFLNGTNFFNKLTLNSGYWYRVQADSLIHPGSISIMARVQKINVLEVEGDDCEFGLTMLTSSDKGRYAFIDKQGSSFATDNLFVQDIHNVGEDFTIDKGIDGGGNEGFIFTNPYTEDNGRDLYWVNGQGIWSDPNHWSTISGGPGGECIPRMFDNVFFDGGSGFVEGTDTAVLVDVKHAWCNDMTWVDDVILTHAWFISGDTLNDTTIIYSDSTMFHLLGSLELDPMMTNYFLGELHFESYDDDDYETLDFEYSFDDVTYFSTWNKAYFNGREGKWKFLTNWTNTIDTVHFLMGDILAPDILPDTIILDFLLFSSLDTMPRRLNLLGKTLVVLHKYQADAWNVNSSYSLTGDTLFWLDAGRSTIRSLGDMSPPPGAPPGFCHIRSFGSELKYHNLEFGWAGQPIGLRSMLKSESQNTFNLVDYYYAFCDGVGTGIVDTLTWKETSTGSRLRNNYEINFVYAYAFGDTLMQSHKIDTAIFYDAGALYGGHFVGYLEAHKFMGLSYVNTIDTAYLYGDADILGRNVFSQLYLGPNKRFRFEADSPTNDYDSTIIVDDWIVDGFCDQPINISSDSAGAIAVIDYQKLNPTNHNHTMIYSSVKDIYMVPNQPDPYIALESIDLGNNHNLEFEESSTGGNTFYWIGGEGKWGDLQHWSYTSGGPPVADGCTPRENSTVVFDDNSFEKKNDVVLVDVTNAYCDNMYWIHDGSLFKPIFYGTDSTSLNVYGSMILNDSMDYLYQGIIRFSQYYQPGVIEPDTFNTRAHMLWNSIYLEGNNDIIMLDDTLNMYVEPNLFYSNIFHNQGEFWTNNYDVTCGAYLAKYPSERKLDIRNTTFTLLMDNNTAWEIDATDFTLLAENSTIVNAGQLGMARIKTRNGDYLKYNDVIMQSSDSLFNWKNTVEYNLVNIEADITIVGGNFIADSVILNGGSSAMVGNSETNVVILNGYFATIKDNHNINRGIVNNHGILRSADLGTGNAEGNFFKYCVFNDDGYFYGQNEFDTLIFYPGTSDANNQGNWFSFEFEKDQIIYDSLYLRGNQCSNITIRSTNAAKLAYLKKDYGLADVSCDYLHIISVGTKSEKLDWYTGTNSYVPNPDSPPPSWIYDNAQGYIFGFDGRTERFCNGEEYVLDGTAFNGDALTQYFWEGSQYPGDPLYTVNQAGTYHVRVQYNDDCYVDDYLVLEADFPPIASIGEGPYCEGDMIEVTVSPNNSNYIYEWWNGETTSSIEAQVQYTGGIYVGITDPVNNCKASPNQSIVVKPVPKPETALGADVTIKFGESITLDAGFGDYYEWSADPDVPIDNPNNRTITVPGYQEPIEYTAYVEIDGCPAEGLKVVSMYPPSKLGVPTAFSPNGDGENDELYVEGSGFAELDFKVYNRYGEMVFQTNDKEVGWDGTYNGKKQEMDVYTYYIRVLYLDKGAVEESGNITLLR